MNWGSKEAPSPRRQHRTAPDTLPKVLSKPRGTAQISAPHIPPLRKKSAKDESRQRRPLMPRNQEIPPDRRLRPSGALLFSLLQKRYLIPIAPIHRPDASYHPNNPAREWHPLSLHFPALFPCKSVMISKQGVPEWSELSADSGVIMTATCKQSGTAFRNLRPLKRCGFFSINQESLQSH